MTLPVARSATQVGSGVALAVLVLLAARTDLADPHSSASSVVADLAVGLAFAAAGAVSRGRTLTRWLLAGVGLSWLAASVLPTWSGLHQGLLLLAIASLGGAGTILLAALGAPAAWVATGLPSEATTGAAFLVLAATVVGAVRLRTLRTATAATAAVAVGACLLARTVVADQAPDAYDPEVALASYQLVLLSVALVAGVVSRAGVTGTARLLADAGESGVAGLTAVLARTLRDPTLRVLPPDALVAPGSRVLDVEDAGTPVARILHRTGALDDASSAAPVAQAVRLTMRQQALQAEQRHQLGRLEAARSRILAAADRQRSRAAETLRGDVATLDAVRHSLVAGSRPGADDDPVRVASDQLGAASEEILGLVAGVPPVALGDGRLADALEELAARCPVPAFVRVASEAVAPSAVETTAYFVAAEALTNAAKHAAAGRCSVTVDRDEIGLRVVVEDDGMGGADPGGAGLRGLTDRVEAVGGRLLLVSTAGAGTTLSAVLPVEELSRSGSTAR